MIRFAYLSTIKVKGELTITGHLYIAEDTSAPKDLSGVSKYDAKQAIRQMTADLNMELVMI